MPALFHTLFVHLRQLLLLLGIVAFVSILSAFKAPEFSTSNLILLDSLQSLSSIDFVDQKKLDQVIQMCETETSKEDLPECYLYLANLHQELGSFKKALDYYLQSLDLQGDIIDSQKLANTYSGIGQVYLSTGNINQAIHYFEQALEAAQQKEDNSSLLSIRSKLSSAYFKQADYSSAEQQLQESLLSIDNGSGNPIEIARIHRDLGTLYAEVGLDSFAATHLSLSLDFGNIVANNEVLSQSYLAQGDFFFGQNNLERAHNSYTQGYILVKDEDNQALKSAAYLGLGKIEFKEKNFEKSLDHLIQVITSPSYGSFEQKAEALAYIGRIYIQLDNSSSAIDHCAEGYDLSLEAGLPRLMRVNCQCLRQAYQIEGQFQKALEMADQLDILDEKLNEVEALKRISTSQLAKEIGKIEQEKLDQTNLFSAKERLREQEVEGQRNRIMWLSAIVILSVIIGLILLFLYRSRRKLNKQLNELNLDLNDANKHLEQKNAALENLNLKLNENNSALNNFAAVAAHDLKAPLRTIKSFSQLLHREFYNKIDKEKTEYFHFISGSTIQLSKMIDDLLDFSKMGQDMPLPVAVDMTAVLTEVRNRLKAATNENNGQIIFDPLPAVKAQHSLLTQLFQNLIHNSLKFAKSDVPPQVKIRLEPHEDLSMHYFVVSDNGIGIPQAQVKAVFGVFRRLYNNDEYEGSGVGLATCKKIVEHFGGEIWITSKENIGTKIHLTLPKA